MLQEFVLRRALLSARSRETSRRGQGVGSLAVPGFISWFQQADTEENFLFPHQP